MKSFEDLAVWQEGCKIAKEIYQVTGEGDLTKDFGLRDQIRRIVIASETKQSRLFYRDCHAPFGCSQ